MRFRRSIPTWSRHARGWSLLVGCMTAATRVAAATEPEPPTTGAGSRPPASRAAAPGPVLPIRTEAGLTSFDLPPREPGAQTLLVVSSLTQAAGPSPIRVRAEPITSAPRPLPVMALVTTRPPNTDLPPVVPVPAPTTRLPPADRTFHLMTQAGLPTDPASYRAIPSRLRAVGRRVQVYVDVADAANVDPATLRDIVDSFDHRIWPAVAERFGPATDVDGDGRFTILLTRWLSRLADGKVRVDGFVRGADLDRRQPSPFGNRSDMMYLNAHLKAGPHLRTVLAHEYAHAVTFSRHLLDRAGDGPLDAAAEEEGWLDEAIAHLVEDELGFSRSNLDYRISAFLSQPERYRLVVDDYFSADLFRSHGNRGATYLFLRWCVDRFGPRLLDALVRSPRRGVANLEAATGTPFAELFRSWTVALYRSGLDPKGTDRADYRSVNPRGGLDDWVLAGPRTTTINPGGAADAWSAEGTSSHFVLINPTAGSERAPVRIELEGPPGADLQVTAVALPAGLARPELVVQPQVAADGSIRVRAQVSEAGGAPVRLGALAWERLVPPADLHAPGFRRDALDGAGVTSAFGAATLPGWGALRSRPISLPGVRSTDGPLVFKAVGIDSQGRKVAAWAVVEPMHPTDALAWDDNPP